MDDRAFKELLRGVKELGKLRRGEAVNGVKITEVKADVEARAVREITKLSQAEFAELVNVPVTTLRNWEQNRTKPTGPARALLRAIANDPRAVLKALHG